MPAKETLRFSVKKLRNISQLKKREKRPNSLVGFSTLQPLFLVALMLDERTGSRAELDYSSVLFVAG